MINYAEVIYTPDEPTYIRAEDWIRAEHITPEALADLHDAFEKLGPCTELDRRQAYELVYQTYRYQQELPVPGEPPVSVWDLPTSETAASVFVLTDDILETAQVMAQSMGRFMATTFGATLGSAGDQARIAEAHIDDYGRAEAHLSLLLVKVRAL